MCCRFEVTFGGDLICIMRLMVFMSMLSFSELVVMMVGSWLVLRLFLIRVCCFLFIELWCVWVSMVGVLLVALV